MSKKPTDPMHQRIIQGTRAGSALAVERARQTGTPLVVWRDGQIVEISPDDVTLPSDAKSEQFFPDKTR